MDNATKIRQQISELADGELADAKASATILALRDPKHLQDWLLYHRIGEVLRSEQMSLPVSAEFSARLAARLEAEPTVLLPQKNSLKKRLCNWPGTFAAIAATGLFFVLAPSIFSRWMPGQINHTVASSDSLASAPLSVARDGQFDHYILVHQSAYSPLYGSAQLGRPVASAGSDQ